MAKQQKIVWRKAAFQMLLDIGEYLATIIGQQKANVFVKEITEKTEKLKLNPAIAPPCRFRLLRQNNFRCLRHKRYIIIYKIIKNEIRIYGIIHERRNPKIFEDLAK